MKNATEIHRSRSVYADKSLELHPFSSLLLPPPLGKNPLECYGIAEIEEKRHPNPKWQFSIWKLYSKQTLSFLGLEDSLKTWRERKEGRKNCVYIFPPKGSEMSLEYIRWLFYCITLP